jgi:hypothetical protein
MRLRRERAGLLAIVNLNEGEQAYEDEFARFGGH